MTAPELTREQAIREEASRALRASRIADLTCVLLAQTRNLTPGEALDLISVARLSVLEPFPEKEPVFNLVYRRRLLRIVTECFGLPEDELHPQP
jgi:hypothetical protein